MYEQSEHISEIAKALLNVQKSLPIATKDAVNPFVKNRYASLNSIMEACHRPLLENGIVVVQAPVPVAEPGSLGLMTRLIHAESGQWLSSVAVIPLAKADPQGMGAAITYARRYALSAMLGIVTGDDGDCDPGWKSAAEPGQRKQAQNPAPAVRKETGQDDCMPQETGPHYGEDPFYPGGQTSHEPPKLPGIQYSRRDGQIIASGETVKNKESLKAAGFRWNPGERVWTRNEGRQAAYA